LRRSRFEVRRLDAAFERKPRNSRRLAWRIEKSIDCRDYPSEKNCSLKISGAEEEVLDAAVQHAISAHGHQNTPGIARPDQIDARRRPINAPQQRQ